jgi:hypothetical protein
MEKTRKARAGNPEGKRPFERITRGWEDNIKIHLI